MWFDSSEELIARWWGLLWRIMCGEVCYFVFPSYVKDGEARWMRKLPFPLRYFIRATVYSDPPCSAIANPSRGGVSSVHPLFKAHYQHMGDFGFLTRFERSKKIPGRCSMLSPRTPEASVRSSLALRSSSITWLHHCLMCLLWQYVMWLDHSRVW